MDLRRAVLIFLRVFVVILAALVMVGFELDAWSVSSLLPRSHGNAV